MPVQFDDYEAGAEDADWTVTEGSNAYEILSFLIEHPDTGFTPSEIAEATGIPKGSVGPTLQRLHERDLVRHKEPYWAIGDGDRVTAYETMIRSMEAIHDREGGEWADVDPEEYAADEDELDDWRERQRSDDP